MAAIAPWFCLRLPSWGPGSIPKHTNYAFFNMLKLQRENNENKQKEAGIGTFKKENKLS